MIRLIAIAAFALALATSAEAMSPAPLHQPDSMTTQVRYYGYGYRRYGYRHYGYRHYGYRNYGYRHYGYGGYYGRPYRYGSTAETGGIETATEPSRAGTERRNVRLRH